MTTSLALGSAWVLWETRAGPQADAAVAPVASVRTAAEYWTWMVHLPQPSALFSNRSHYVHIERPQALPGSGAEPGQAPASRTERVSIRGWALFRDGIRPEWEDPACCTGYSLAMHKCLSPSQLDSLWHALCIMAVTGSAEESTTVTLPSLPQHAQSLREADLLSMGMEGDHAALAQVSGLLTRYAVLASRQSTKERAMYLIEVWITSGHTLDDVAAVQAKVHAALQRMLPTTLPVQLSRQARTRTRLDMLGPAEPGAAPATEAQHVASRHVQFSGVSIARRTEADIAAMPAHELPPAFCWKIRDHAACLVHAAT